MQKRFLKLDPKLGRLIGSCLFVFSTGWLTSAVFLTQLLLTQTSALAQTQTTMTNQPAGSGSEFLKQLDWKRKGSTSVSAYAGSVLQYYDDKETGAYRGLGLDFGYAAHEKLQLSLSSSYQQNLNTDLYYDREADFGDLDLGASIPGVASFGAQRLDTSFSLTYPVSRYSRGHDFRGAIGNSWRLAVPTPVVNVSPSLSYRKNFYEKTLMTTELSGGDSIGRSFVDQTLSSGLGLSKSFSFGLSLSGNYGMTRVYPFQGRILTRNSSSITMGYTYGKFSPYVSVRTGASQLRPDGRINYAVFEKNRTQGEIGFSVNF